MGKVIGIKNSRSSYWECKKPRFQKTRSLLNTLEAMLASDQILEHKDAMVKMRVVLTGEGVSYLQEVQTFPSFFLSKEDF